MNRSGPVTAKLPLQQEFSFALVPPRLDQRYVVAPEIAFAIGQKVRNTPGR